MKNWKQFTFVAFIAIVGIIMGFMACDNNGNETTHVHDWGDWTVTTASTCTTEGVKTRVCKLDATHTETQSIAIDPNAHLWGDWTVTTPATATAEGVSTRTCQHNSAHKETRKIEQTEPTKKQFPVSFDFQMADGSAIREAVIQDIRTNCGSQNLEQLGIITIIEEAMMETFNTKATSTILKNRFRGVFGWEGGVKIYVENPTTVYKMKATDNQTIYFHIDYLKSNPVDIQQNIFDAVSAMWSLAFPWDAEKNTLTGTVSISPESATIGTELTANYSGSETINYQWRKGRGGVYYDNENGVVDIVDQTLQKFTPNEAGGYNVKVYATGYNPITSSIMVNP